MDRVAWLMLVGDRVKYVGIVCGISFAAFLITQQASIFFGLLSRTYGFVTDCGHADLWICDPKVQFIDDIKPMQDTELYRVRSLPGVAWATPLYKGLLRARLADGNFQTCNLIGLDDATLTGGPPELTAGRLVDLRQSDAVIVDEGGANGKFARHLPDGRTIPLAVGDTIELNDHRAVVVGLCRVSRTFQSNPVIYTTFARATTFVPRERKLLSFILAGITPGFASDTVCATVAEHTGLAAYPREEFKAKTFWYYINNTGIPINFGISVLLGFIIGTAIAGLLFYQFTTDNLRYWGALKAMGASHGTLLRMVLLQALVVGALGYGLGVGMAALFGWLTSKSELAFLLLPWLLLVTAAAVLLIVLLAALLSLWKVLRLEAAVVFRG